MEATRLSMEKVISDSCQIDDIPEPARSYFKKVLKENPALIQSVRIKQSGTFNTGQTKEKWKRFESRQYVVTHPPSFIWDARIRIVPFLNVFVHDGYVEGRGILEANLLGLIKLMGDLRIPEVDQGELMRYLAEAVWFPTALLPSQGVKWEAIDHSHASATIIDGNAAATLVFEFDNENLISSVYADARAMIRGKEIKFESWQGRFWNYDIKDGMLIPLEGEVAWLIEGKRLPYWRGRIEEIEYRYFE
ncbi:MAG: DUF6920 family protein [bacterium]